MYSKSAIGHATASLAHELLPLGVRVNGISPGFFVTDMSAPGTMNELGQSRMTHAMPYDFQIPVSRPPGPGQPPAGTNKDMGALVLFLVANWFVDGETVLIDGGVSTYQSIRIVSSVVDGDLLSDTFEEPVVLLSVMLGKYQECADACLPCVDTTCGPYVCLRRGSPTTIWARIILYVAHAV